MDIDFRQTLHLGLLLALFVAGCTQEKPPAADAPPTKAIDIDVNGIHYDVPATIDPNNVLRDSMALQQSITPTGIKWSNGLHHLEVINGAVTLNGGKYGTVKAGDRVKVTAQGAFIVNGTERRPDGELPRPK